MVLAIIKRSRRLDVATLRKKPDFEGRKIKSVLSFKRSKERARLRIAERAFM